MPEKEQADIISVLKNLCLKLQPIASSRHIQLCFSATEEKILFYFTVSEVWNGFSKLISSIIEYMPDNNTLHVSAAVTVKEDANYVSVRVHNTGINLKMVTALVNNSCLPVKLLPSLANETTYEICYSLSPLQNDTILSEPLNGKIWNYVTIVKGIKSHFAKLNNPVARLADTRPKEAAFLTSINNCILEHLADDQFDANALSTAMSMSRAQLLRRLKSLTGNSPAYYIKTMRLEKAKELLETTDITVSEAAFQTGFNSHSNFTKVFSEKYGINPSQFLRTQRKATNE